MTKIGHIYIPFKFAYGECIRPKSNARVKLIRTHKVRLASRQQIITPPETANQWENGTSWRQCSQLQTRFPLISIVQWRVEKDDTIIGKVAKGKGKPPGKMEKTENMLRSKTTNRQSKLRFERLLMILYHGWYEKAGREGWAEKAGREGWPRRLAEKAGREGWPRRLAEKAGREGWPRRLAEKAGREGWPRRLAEKAGREGWPRRLAEKAGREGWPRRLAEKAGREGWPRRLAEKAGREGWPRRLAEKAGREGWPRRLAEKAGREGWPRRLAEKAGLEGWPRRLAEGLTLLVCAKDYICLS